MTERTIRFMSKRAENRQPKERGCQSNTIQFWAPPGPVAGGRFEPPYGALGVIKIEFQLRAGLVGTTIPRQYSIYNGCGKQKLDALDWHPGS